MRATALQFGSHMFQYSLLFLIQPKLSLGKAAKDLNYLKGNYCCGWLGHSEDPWTGYEKKSNRKHTEQDLPTDRSQPKANLMVASPEGEDNYRTWNLNVQAAGNKDFLGPCQMPQLCKKDLFDLKCWDLPHFSSSTLCQDFSSALHLPRQHGLSLISACKEGLLLLFYLAECSQISWNKIPDKYHYDCYYYDWEW